MIRTLRNPAVIVLLPGGLLLATAVAMADDAQSRHHGSTDRATAAEEGS